jgi:hypothetical protein
MLACVLRRVSLIDVTCSLPEMPDSPPPRVKKCSVYYFDVQKLTLISPGRMAEVIHIFKPFFYHLF